MRGRQSVVACVPNITLQSHGFSKFHQKALTGRNFKHNVSGTLPTVFVLVNMV
jgi:hypothetical protein